MAVNLSVWMLLSLFSSNFFFLLQEEMYTHFLKQEKAIEPCLFLGIAFYDLASGVMNFNCACT